MNDIEILKKEYNMLLKRNLKAEEYFNTHNPEECLKYINLFNEITVSLGKTKTKLEKLLNRKLSDYETFNGFEN